MQSVDEQIRKHSLKYISTVGHKYLAAFVLLPGITFFVVRPEVPLWTALPWLIASYGLAVYRYLLLIKVRATGVDALDPDFSGGRLTLSSFISGCLWGLAAVLFAVPDSLGIQLYIYLTVFVLASVTMILYAYWIAAYYAFTVPALFGVFVSLLSVGSTEYYAFAFLTILYASIVVPMARSQQQLANESLELRFKQAELLEELKLEKEAAEQANLSKSKFLAAASHDLRQPLHSIGLFSAALGNRSGGAEETAIIENIDKAVASLDTLLSSLLDISRLDADVVSPQLEHIDLTSEIERLDAEYAPQAQEKGLSWRSNVGKVAIYSDPTLFETILRNLISNAIRYTDSGAIAITGEQDDDFVWVKITDTGAGIPVFRQKDVFREFFQLPHPNRDSAKGVGLGLAIVDRLARLLNIDVALLSEPGAGTTFTLRVRRGDATEISKSTVLQDILPHDGRETLVLVVDNERKVLAGMKALLKSWHYRVLCARNERQALRALSLAKATPDIVLADYQLDNEVTGVEVLASLSGKLNSPFNAIILTGDTSQACILDVHNNQYKLLHKPVAPGRLRAMLIGFELD